MEVTILVDSYNVDFLKSLTHIVECVHFGSFLGKLNCHLYVTEQIGILFYSINAPSSLLLPSSYPCLLFNIRNEPLLVLKGSFSRTNYFLSTLSDKCEKGYRVRKDVQP